MTAKKLALAGAALALLLSGSLPGATSARADWYWDNHHHRHWRDTRGSVTFGVYPGYYYGYPDPGYYSYPYPGYYYPPPPPPASYYYAEPGLSVRIPIK